MKFFVRICPSSGVADAAFQRTEQEKRSFERDTLLEVVIEALRQLLCSTVTDRHFLHREFDFVTPAVI